MKRDDATERQITAADPGTSTWVSANAGSGKTRVLTDRVARLLLQGVPPQRVLCLTYTKAAATEMQNRLFKRLGRWVMAADRDLDAALEDLGVPAAQNTREARAEARTLFARAIETPGGLKIQTIHSFCAAMLRQFPLEAGVSPNFRELDARDAKALRDQILDEIAEGPDRDRLSDLAAYVTDAKIDDLGAELASERERLAGPVDPAAIFDALGIDPQMTPETVVEETFSPGDPALIARLVPALQSGSTQDNKAAAKLSALTTGGPSFDWLPALESVLLFGGSAGDPFGPKIGKFPTRGTQASLGDDLESLNAMMQRVADARPRRLALEAATKTLALLRFAEVFLPRYAEAKAQRGVLDFDDQILKARALLSDSSVAQWVLFRLDGGIDHILVDEAQDTSPPQWDVIRLLAEEFSSGEGAREDIERTIFVVGDPKQSIYSFQGADPRGFDRMRAHFKEKLKAVNKPFQFLPLHFSFRSAPAILRFVDDAFSALGHAGLGDTSEHIAFRTGMPGRVDVWPALAKAPEPDEKHWTDTVDQKADDDPRLELARKIACEIRDMVGNGVQIEDKDGVIRPVTPKDFLVLVRRRSEIFHEVIRACKEIGVPIAGSDRLRVGAELAVKDILALLNFAATPEDDLALACALRSPLFGWSEAQLYALAQPRKKAFLWEELRNATDNHPETLEVLQDVLKNADFLRPYELLERILTRHDGRGRLLARLGREAEDGIDALLSQAIDYESRHVPSLTGFLSWFHASEEDNKRQLDSSRDEVRVMTVHGAKGLEGSIVILPDCTKPVSRSGQKTSLRLRDDMVVWRSAKADAPPMLTAALEEEQRLEREERMRLLYVALTRAESWLIVAAAGETGSGGDSWYSIVAEAAERHGPSIPIETPLGTGTRIEGGEWPEPTGAPAGTSEENATAVPEWARVRPPAPPEKPLLLSPSKLGGDKILAGEGVGEDSDTAMLRGTRVHLLLEHLPQASTSRHRALALQLLQSPEPSPEEFEDVFAEAQAVLTSAELAPVFGPETLAEVDVSAGLPQVGSARMFGTIDRLIVESDRVCAIDFKSNAAVPQTPDETPEGLLRQMGAYASALAQIFPDRRIETAILWTRTATLMPLPHEVVTQALVRATPS